MHRKNKSDKEIRKKSRIGNGQDIQQRKDNKRTDEQTTGKELL